MAVTNLITSYLGGGRYRVSWSMTGDLAYLWRDAILTGTTPGTTWDVSVSPGETVRIEVFDDAVSTPAAVLPGKAIFQWGEVTDASTYRIEEYIVDTWTKREGRLSHGDGRRYEYVTRYLDDETEYQWRIVPVSSAGIDGTPLYFDVTILRYPDKPDVDLSLTASGEVYVEAG